MPNKKKNALQWIVAEAKHLRNKDGNRKPWKTYFNQATAIYASKHKGKSPVGKPRKRKVVKKKKTVRHKRKTHSINGNTTKSRTHTDNNKFRNVDISIGAVNSHIKRARYCLEQQLSEKLLQAFKTKEKTKKKEVAKKIRELKSKIHKLS